MTQLLAINGSLYTPVEAASKEIRGYDPEETEGFILIHFYSSGDVDTISFPDFNPDHLKGALFSAREQGYFPDCQAVLLPDGTEFAF